MITQKRRFEIFKRDDFTCKYCGGKPPEKKLTLDHKVAKSKGGSDEDSNLVTACSDCNLAKGNTPLDELQNTPATIRVNLDISDEWNVHRVSLGATWREVIIAGLESLSGIAIKQKPKTPTSVAIEASLKQAVQHISKAWELIKKNPL
jgi:hypothetical protein